MKWFRHETSALQDLEIRKVIKTHGAAGYAIWFAIIENLYAAEGDFQIQADDLWLEALAEDLKISDCVTLLQVLDTFAEIGLISSRLWAKRIVHVESLAKTAEALKKDFRKELGDDPQHQNTAYRKHRDEVFERDGYQCVYCGSPKNLSLDHIIPQSRGGSHDLSNLACACKSCNSRKHARTPEEWGGR